MWILLYQTIYCIINRLDIFWLIHFQSEKNLLLKPRSFLKFFSSNCSRYPCATTRSSNDAFDERIIRIFSSNSSIFSDCLSDDISLIVFLRIGFIFLIHIRKLIINIRVFNRRVFLLDFRNSSKEVLGFLMFTTMLSISLTGARY